MERPGEHLSNINRAALIVHEAVYKILRERELARNSRKARMIVARLFSSTPSDGANGDSDF